MDSIKKNSSGQKPNHNWADMDDDDSSDEPDTSN